MKACLLPSVILLSLLRQFLTYDRDIFYRDFHRTSISTEPSMSCKTDFLSWDDDSIPWNLILENDDSLPLEDDCPPSGSENKENLPTEPREKKSTQDQMSCPKCPRNYKTVSGFKRHMANFHRDSVVIGSDSVTSGCAETRLEIQSLVTMAFLPALLAVMTSPFRNGSSAFGAEVVEVAAALKETSDNARTGLMKLLVEEFVQIFPNGKYVDLPGASQRERLCISYGRLFASRPKMKALQEAVRFSLQGHFMTEPGIRRFTICFCRQLLQTVLDNATSAKKKQISPEVQQLTNNDQSVLYYISGFILHSLKVQLAPQKSREDLRVAIDGVIDANSKYNKTFLQKYKDWTKKLNRGGLILPCDDFFMLVREFEVIVRKAVSQGSLCADSLNKNNLTNKIFDGFMVQHYWDRLCTASSSVKDLLLEMIAKKFLTVRGFAVARLLNSDSKSHQKSLRKGLNLKSAK